LVCRETAGLLRGVLPWGVLRRAARRLEARGELLGGRFVAGLSGEQFALPAVPDLLSDPPVVNEPLLLVRGDPLVQVAGQVSGLAVLEPDGQGVRWLPTPEAVQAAS